MSNHFELAEEYDAVVTGSDDNTFYFSGYKSSACIVVITKTSRYFLTDSRYGLEAKERLSKNFEIIVAKNGLKNALREFLDKLGCRKIGLDESITYGEYADYLKVLQGLDIENIAEKLLNIRAVKSAEEIEIIKSAQKIADKSFGELKKFIEKGITERELAARLEFIMKINGAERESFETIAAFGENTAKPHAHPSETALKENQPILLDFGAKYKGYCSDMTRTLYFGTPSDKFVSVYESVLKANEIGIETANSGAKASEVDAASRKVLARDGLAQYFTHSLGHGVGVAIHEEPVLSPRSDAVLKSGMVVTIEPGVYLDNEFGIRIEDMLLVGKKSTVLTECDKKLTIIH